MVTAAGEGTTSSAYGGGGGAGGKFRKRPLRKSQTTPYDRPPTAFRNPSWLSKLVVEPASKLISAGAHRFFSTVFRKRLTSSPHPSPQPPEEKQESRNGHHETVPDNHARPQEPEKIVGVSSKRKSDTTTNGISELEQLLSEKSFTKSEIACLTELLQSRAVDSPVKDDGIMSEANLSIQNNFSKPTSDTRKRQEFSIPPEGNKIETVRANGALTTPTLSKTNEKYQLLEDDIAAPAELAKAYMGSRSSKVSPSKLGMRSQIAREDAVLFNNSIFSPKSPMTLENTGHVGPSRNGFTTPRSLGRSAIYNMARTPYSRVPTSIQKASGSRNFEYGGTSSSPSQSMWESSGGLVSFRPASLKRRSSVFDEDIGGSVGPIRRIRQKSNLSSNRTSLTSRGTGLASDSSQLHKQETENRVSNARSKDYSQIPRASSEMAARIFEQLDKMTPKEKSSESKLAAAKGASSFKLTTNMLHGQALSSMENLDASKLMQNSLIEHKLEVNQPIKSLPDPHESTTTTTNHKQSRVEENGSAKIVNPPSTEDTPKPKFTPQLSEPKFTPQSSERKRGFKMSAFEDFADMDDDVPLSEATGVEKSVKMSKSIASEVSSEKNPVLSQVKTHPVPLVFKKSEVDTSNASTEATEKATPASDPPLAESFGLKNTESVVPPTESKPEKPSSLMNTKSTDTTANGELGTVPISTNSVFSTGASNIFSNNGNIGSTISSSFAPISESKNPINSSSSFISSTGTTAISNTDSNTVASNVAPVTPGPFSAISQVTTTGNSETTGLKENGFGKLGNFSTFGTDLSGAGSKVFGTSASVAASESSIMTQGTGSSLSMPIQFGSSSSPTLFNAPPSGITSFTSSAPATSTATATVSDSSASTSQTNTFKYGSLESNTTTTTTTTPGVFPFNSTSSSASQSVTGNGIFNFGGTTFPANSGTGTVTSTTSAPSVFNFGGSKPASSSETTTTTTTTTMFSSGWPASNSPSPAFVSSTFGSTPVGFGMNNTTSSAPVFSFPSMAAPTTTSPSPTTQPIFGANSPNPFATNKDPMSPDDNSMAEDRQSPAAPAASLFGQSAPAPAVSLFGQSAAAPAVSIFGQSAAAQAGSLFGQSPATPAAAPFGQSSPAAQGFGAQSPAFNFGSQAPAPAFGQAPISPSPPGFMFNSNVQSPAPTFQFGGQQQGQPSPQTPGQFQATGSLDFNAGGSFSLGSGAPDKSNRRIVKPNRNRLKKK